MFQFDLLYNYQTFSNKDLRNQSFLHSLAELLHENQMVIDYVNKKDYNCVQHDKKNFGNQRFPSFLSSELHV